jgi:hypothetical protein
MVYYLEVGEGSLHEAPVLLVVVQQVVPQRLLRQHLITAPDTSDIKHRIKILSPDMFPMNFQ